MGKSANRTFRGTDGTDWRIEIRTPGASNAMVVFHHPNGSRLNRYAWYLSNGAESRSVTARMEPARVLEAINDRQLAQLFRRSMPVETTRTPYNLQNRAG